MSRAALDRPQKTFINLLFTFVPIMFYRNRIRLWKVHMSSEFITQRMEYSQFYGIWENLDWVYSKYGYIKNHIKIYSLHTI